MKLTKTKIDYPTRKSVKGTYWQTVYNNTLRETKSEEQARKAANKCEKWRVSGRSIY